MTVWIRCLACGITIRIASGWSVFTCGECRHAQRVIDAGEDR